MSVAVAQRFLEAFSAAVHDVHLEDRGYRIWHYFDSDFLGRLIFGFRDPLNHALIHESKAGNPSNAANQKLLMGALVGQGIGAPNLMRALPPHLYEIRRAVGRDWPEEAGRTRDLTINLLGLESLLAELRAALHEPATAKPLDERAADDLLDRFLDHGPEIFYGVELLSGAWKSRLGRVLQLGIHETSPFDDEPSLSDSAGFEVLARHVGESNDDGPHSGVNGLRDAIALGSLADGVALSRALDPPFDIVRFYTETPRILTAWRQQPAVRELLTYGVREHGLAPLDLGVHGVIRTHEYYLIRALFPELQHRPVQRDVGTSSWAEDVFGVGRDLADAAEQLRRGGIHESELSAIKVGSNTLGEFMAEVTDLSSYGTAWRRLLRADPSGVPRRLLQDLDEVRHEGLRRTQELERSFVRQITSLANRTREVARFTESYVHLRSVLDSWTGALRPQSGSLVDHVGLPRWGFGANDVDEEMLTHLVESFEDRSAMRGDRGSEADTWRNRFVIELAHRLRELAFAPLDDLDEMGPSVALLGFLWIVGDYRSVVNHGTALMKSIELRLGRDARSLERANKTEDARWRHCGGALENFVAAAQVGRAVADTRETSKAASAKAAELVREARDVYKALAPDRRRFPASTEAIAITQGYVLFHTWLRFNAALMADAWVAKAKPHQPALLRDSLDVCAAALDACEPDTPMYTLLLNHCVYVSAMGRVADERSASWARHLIVRRPSEGQAWSYRLDDTLGYYYFTRAATAVAQTASLDPARLQSASKDLAEAHRWFERIPDAVDDAEVVAHRALARELEVEVERLIREQSFAA